MGAFNTSYADTGLFGVYFVAEPTSVWNATSLSLHEMVRLANDPTDDEVERAKAQLKTSLLKQLDGSTAVCEDIGRQLLAYGRRMTPAELFARIDAVDSYSVAA